VNVAFGFNAHSGWAAVPGWTTDEILSIYSRMHKAEGVLFRDVLLRASRACKLRTVEVPLAALAALAALEGTAS